jgi:hypothetical protein
MWVPSSPSISLRTRPRVSANSNASSIASCSVVAEMSHKVDSHQKRSTVVAV